MHLKRFLNSILLLLCSLMIVSIASGQDSLNVTMLSRIDYWDSPYSSAVHSNYLIVATNNSGIKVLDISDPANPFQVGRFDTYGDAYDVVVSGDIAFVADAGFLALDISDPTSPEELCYLEYTSFDHSVRCIAISGNYAYVAGYDNLSIVDISEPENLVIVSSIPIYLDDVYGIVAAGDFCYICGQSQGTKIIDISNPYSPSIITTIPDADGDAIALSDNYAYIAGINRFLIFDVLNPYSPQLVERYGNFELHDVTIVGNRMYLAASTNGMKIFDLSNPANPVKLGSYNPSNEYLWRVTVNNSIAYVSSYNWYTNDYYRGISIIDVSNPSNPDRNGCYISRGENCDVQIIDNYALLANDSFGFEIMDISDPNTPVSISNLELEGQTRFLLVRDEYVYISADDYGLYVVNISNPEIPQIIGTCQTNVSMYELAIYNSYLYVAGYSDDLHIFNISNPASPYLENDMTVPGQVQDVYVYNNYLYVLYTLSGSDYGMYVMDITDAVNPDIVGTFDSSSQTTSLIVENGYAYIACSGSDEIEIVNISTPTFPYLVDSYETDYPSFLYINGNYLYVSSYWNGLSVFHLISPTNLELVGYYETPGNGWGLYADDEYIYFADKYAFEIFEFEATDLSNANNIEYSLQSFSLLPPQPNPFNPQTTLRYELKNSANVMIKIYDITGREIANLVDSFRNSGSYEVIFDGTDLASGIYFAQLDVGISKQVQKLLLVK